MTFNDVEAQKKWPIVGGLSTQSDGGVQRKAVNNSTSTVSKVHKLLCDTEYVPSQIIYGNHGVFAELSYPSAMTS